MSVVSIISAEHAPSTQPREVSVHLPVVSCSAVASTRSEMTGTGGACVSRDNRRTVPSSSPSCPIGSCRLTGSPSAVVSV